MATYLTLNSKFTPYTYEEILKPYLDRLKALEEKLAALEETSAKASLWEGILDPVADKAYYESFNEFKSRLEDLSGRLSAGDASAVTKKELSRLKLEYNKLFVPLELKYAELKLAQEELRKAALQAAVSGKNVRFTKDMQGVSLSSALTDPTWNQYGTILLDDISEKAIAAGTAYGKNAAFYNVFGTTRGNTTPEDINAALEKLYDLYIPSGISTSLSDEIKKVISSSFLLGSKLSYAEDISDILSTDIARSTQATNAATARRESDFEMYAKAGVFARTNEKGNTIYVDSEGNEVPYEEVLRRVIEYNNKTNNTTPNPKGSTALMMDPATGYYYYEDSNGVRTYYNTSSGAGQIQKEGEYILLKDGRYYNDKTKKYYTKNKDNVMVEDRHYSADYNSAVRKENRRNHAISLKASASSTLIENLEKVYKEDPNNIAIYPATLIELDNGFDDPTNTKKELYKMINNSGYDANDLIVVYRKDKKDDKKKQIMLFILPDEYNKTLDENIEDTYGEYDLYMKGIKKYVEEHQATITSIDTNLQQGNGKAAGTKGIN